MIKALVSEGICNMRLFHNRQFVAMVNKIMLRDVDFKNKLKKKSIHA